MKTLLMSRDAQVGRNIATVFRKMIEYLEWRWLRYLGDLTELLTRFPTLYVRND